MTNTTDRSRSPIRLPNDDLCPICHYEFNDRERWVCANCHDQVHLDCRQRDATGKAQCRLCHMTWRSLANRITAPFRAPTGCACSFCQQWIEPGKSIRRCAQTTSFCRAVWHIECQPNRMHKCPACWSSMQDAVERRRNFSRSTR